MLFAQGFASLELHMSPSRRTSSSGSDAGNGPDPHQVSRVIQALARQDQPQSAIHVPQSLALEAPARRVRDEPGGESRGPAYGMNSCRAGYFGMLEEFLCTQYGSLIDDLGSIEAIEAFMIGLRDSDALLDQTHAFIIAILARTQPYWPVHSNTRRRKGRSPQTGKQWYG